MFLIRKSMRIKAVGMIAAVATLAALAVGVTGAAAQATTTKESSGTLTLIAGNQHHATTSALTVAAANAPSVSPAVRTIHVATGEPYTCDTGNLCLEVWDPTTSSWKVFYLYRCARYALSYFNGWGDFSNYQTGGVTSYFYGQSGNVLRQFQPPQLEEPQDWTPVWSVRNC